MRMMRRSSVGRYRGSMRRGRKVVGGERDLERGLQVGRNLFGGRS